MKEKQKKLEKLFKELGNCNQCLSFHNADKSLINIYQNFDFSVNIPSIWTDWFHRMDSSIMIIGKKNQSYISKVVKLGNCLA